MGQGFVLNSLISEGSREMVKLVQRVAEEQGSCGTPSQRDHWVRNRTGLLFNETSAFGVILSTTQKSSASLLVRNLQVDMQCY